MIWVFIAYLLMSAFVGAHLSDRLLMSTQHCIFGGLIWPFTFARARANGYFKGGFQKEGFSNRRIPPSSRLRDFLVKFDQLTIEKEDT